MTTPARLLALDVGAGHHRHPRLRARRRPENSVKLVVPSRTQVVAGQIREATRRGLPVVFAGPTMGGGPSTKAMLAHLAAGLAFSATEERRAVVRRRPRRGERPGVRLVTDDEVPALLRAGAVEVRSGDVDLPGLLRALAGLGVPTQFTGGCVAAQDHGFDPQRLQPRLSLRALGARPGRPHAARGAVLRRRRGAARAHPPAGGGRRARGSAASHGRRHRPGRAAGRLGDDLRDAVLVNVGNCHTICAVALDGRLAGVYEDHTNRLDGATLEALRAALPGRRPAERRGAAGRRARGRPRRPRARRPARPGHRPAARAARRQLAAGELPGAVRRHDDDRPGRAHRRPSPALPYDGDSGQPRS